MCGIVATIGVDPRGHPQYRALALLDTLFRPRLGILSRDFRSYARTFSTHLLTLWFVRERLSFIRGAYRRRLGSLGTMDLGFVRRCKGDSPAQLSKTVNGRLGADLSRDILPGLPHYGDAISMAHSIESRLLFLDHRLVEFAASLPGDFKVGGGETKRILRDHLRAVDLKEIADRRDKQGYPSPADARLRAGGGAVLRSALLSPSAATRAYCNPKGLERLIDHHVSGGRGAGNHLYRLLATEMWLRTCIEGASGMPVQMKNPAVAAIAR